MKSKVCQVCGSAVPKYKCPKCLIQYCSLGCYKSHKETTCYPQKEKTETAPVQEISGGTQLLQSLNDDEMFNEKQENIVQNEDEEGQLCSRDNKMKNSSCVKENGERVTIQKSELLEEGEISDVDDGVNISFIGDEESGDRVPVEKLRLLEHSSGIMEMLENPHLRNIIEDVYNAKNPAKMMSHAMQEPIFTEFADECLKVVEDKIEVT